ncbi:MAG TPA: hypothetical protein DIU15_19785 [Deltaproteobacteria bacterium]|nr:hypothetical protein [Deltaproteobacteria bacterium]HCP48290.1 hypothetical protein [Deltaproteobacteria bacterium]
MLRGRWRHVPAGLLLGLVFCMVSGCGLENPSPAEGPGAEGGAGEPADSLARAPSQQQSALGSSVAPGLRVERSFRKVVIDAGHGGDDLGAPGVSGSFEKNITLEISRLTRLALQERGFEVISTRTTDEAVLLERRTSLANASGAGLFVSIHANSAPSPSAHGIETYFMDQASDEAAQRLAERENRAGMATGHAAPARDDVGALIADLRVGATAQLSRELADTVHKALVGGLASFYGADRIRDRGVRSAPFWVLVDSEIPAILVEVGYLTHEKEEERVRTRGFQLQVADSIAASLDMFAQRAERSESRASGAGGGLQ